MQKDSTVNSVKICGKSKCIKTRFRIVYSCLDSVNPFKKIGRSRRVSDWIRDDAFTKAIISKNNKWQRWKRFFKYGKYDDVMSKEEVSICFVNSKLFLLNALIWFQTKENQKGVRQRKNAAVFVHDYEEEQSVDTDSNHGKRGSLEICDLEDSGTLDIPLNNSEKKEWIPLNVMIFSRINSCHNLSGNQRFWMNPFLN